MISLVLDIAVNLITLYIYGYRIFAKVNNEFSYIKVKAKMNEGYIQSLIKVIQSEVDNNDKLDKKEEQLNNNQNTENNENTNEGDNQTQGNTNQPQSTEEAPLVQ